MDVPEILSVADARKQLPALLAQLSEGGKEAADAPGVSRRPVFIGRYRKPQGVLISVTEYEQLKRSAERGRAVASALGSLTAEGLQPDTESKLLLDAYTRGEIDADELVARTLDRFAPPATDA